MSTNDQRMRSRSKRKHYSVPPPCSHDQHGPMEAKEGRSKKIKQGGKNTKRLNNNLKLQPSKVGVQQQAHEETIEPRIVVSSEPILAPNHCRRIIKACNRAARKTQASEGAWGKWAEDSDNGYHLATADLEVDAHPEVRRTILANGVFTLAINKHFQRHHKRTIVALDDCFVVKYDADCTKGQRSLTMHTDRGDLSFMVALSDSSDFMGGGTGFNQLDDPLHMDQGHCITFPANMMHCGLPITKGKRYLIVGFCFTEESRESRVAGHVRWPSLTLIKTDDVPPPVYLGLPTFLTNVSMESAKTSALMVHKECGSRSFWCEPSLLDLASEGVKAGLPGGVLELSLLALQLLKFNTLSLKMDTEKFGAEWWLQCIQSDSNIPPHFDKDEWLLKEEGTWRHPVRSTVTYLTTSSHRAPTVVFDIARQSSGGAHKAWLIFPEIGKHLSFDGALLHGVPPGQGKDSDTRITFLMNIWPLASPPLGLLDSSEIVCRQRRVGASDGRTQIKAENEMFEHADETTQSTWKAIKLDTGRTIGFGDIDSILVRKTLPANIVLESCLL